MAKRLETHNEMMQSQFIKIAGALEQIQRQIKEVERKRTQIQERLNTAEDPNERQQYQNFLNSYSDQIKQLRSQMLDLIKSREEQLTYQQLRTLRDDLGFKNEPFEPQKDVYVGPEEGEGPAEQVSFYPAQLEKDLGLPRSDRLRARDELIDFDSAKELLYPDIPTENLTEFQVEEIKSKMRTQQEDVAGYAQERLLKQKEREEQATQKEKAKQRGEEGFYERTLTKNKIWENLKSAYGEVGSDGKLDRIEESIISSMLRTAPQDIPVSEGQTRGSDERWNEFMQDLFNVVQNNRNDVATGQSPQAKYFESPPKGVVNFDDDEISKESATLRKDLPARDPGQKPKIYKKKPVPSGYESEERYAERVERWLEDKLVRGPQIIEQNQKRIEKLKQEIEQSARYEEERAKQPPNYEGLLPFRGDPDDIRLSPNEYENFSKEIQALEGQIKETEETIVWAQQSLEELKTTGKTPKVPGSQKKPGLPPGPSGINSYRRQVTEGLIFGIKDLAQKYPELNIQGARSLGLEEAPPAEKRPYYDFTPGSGASYILSDFDEFDLSGLSKEEIEDKIEEMEKEESAIEPSPYSALNTKNVKSFLKTLFPSGVPGAKSEEEEEAPGPEEEGLALTMEEELNARLDLQQTEEIESAGSEIEKLEKLNENPQIANMKYGQGVIKTFSNGSVDINDLRALPGGSFIESWIRKNNDLDPIEPITAEMIPTNSQAKELLELAKTEMEATRFISRGGGMDVESSDYPEYRARSLAREIISRGFSPRPLNFRAEQPLSREDQQEEKAKRANFEFFGKRDPRFLRDRDLWMNIVLTYSESPNGRELTENQKNAAESYYTYDWWFKNVYDHSGGEKTLNERIEKLQDPEALKEEQEASPMPDYETFLEMIQKEQLGQPEELYDWRDDIDRIKQMSSDLGLEGRDANEFYKSQIEALLLEKIALFMKYDPQIRGFMASRGVYNSRIEGQFQRSTPSRTADVTSVIWDYIAAAVSRRNSGSLTLFEKFVRDAQLKQIKQMRDLKVQTETTGDQAPPPGETREDFAERRRKDIGKMKSMDDVRTNALRHYIVSLGRWALNDAFRKGTRRLNVLKMVSLPGESRRGGESIGQSFNDFIAQQTETDPQNAITSFDEAMSEKIAEMTDRDPENVDASMQDIIQAQTMRQFWSQFKNKLDPNQKLVFDFFYGDGSSRDIYKEGTADDSEYVTLDTQNAVKEWERVFGKKISPSTIAQKKKEIELLIKYAIYTSANASPEFLEILNATIKLEKQTAEQELELFQQQHPGTVQEMERLEEQARNQNVFEEKTTNVSKLYRIKSLRKK